MPWEQRPLTSPDSVLLDWSPSIQEVETGRARVQGRPQLQDTLSQKGLGRRGQQGKGKEARRKNRKEEIKIGPQIFTPPLPCYLTLGLRLYLLDTLSPPLPTHPYPIPISLSEKGRSFPSEACFEDWVIAIKPQIRTSLREGSLNCIHMAFSICPQIPCHSCV